MFQMKFEDVSADIAMNDHHDDESADFFTFFSNEPKNITNKGKNQQQWDFFAESNNLTTFKKEESFHEQLHNNQMEYLNQEDCYFFHQQEAMECENDANKFNREYLYPNMNIFQHFSSWKQESRVHNSKNILIDNQALGNERNISTISWNKLKNYIEISYNLKDSYLMEKKIDAKQACSESQIETIEPSLASSDAQSVKNLENSVTDQEEFLNTLNESSQVNISELSLSHHLDQSSPVHYNDQIENQNEFVSSDFFVFKDSSSQKTAFLQGSYLSEALMQLLTNNASDIQKNIYSSQLISSGFACIKNETNKRNQQQIFEYIFSNMESFSTGQVACEELFAFETIDGFSFTAQVFYQVFPVRGLNGELQGCVIKYHMTIPEKTVSDISQKRESRRQEIASKAEEEELPQPQKIVSKEEMLQKEIQNCKKDDQFSKQVKKFLYKFKYISKQKNQKKQKREQDLFPSKTCKYRLIKQ